jgi:hypothetical protein
MPILTADFFDSDHPLPKVCVLITQNFWPLPSCTLYAFLSFFRTIDSLFHTLLSPEGRQLEADPAPSNSEAPEADECQGEDDAVDSQEDSGSTTRPLLPSLKIKVWRRKGNVLMILFPRVPLIQRMRQENLLLLTLLALRCLMPSTHKFCYVLAPIFICPWLLFPSC